jgi:hypothetical protein
MKVLWQLLLGFCFFAPLESWAADLNVQAQSDFDSVCVARLGQQWFPEIQQLKVNDKVKHCTMSCRLAYRCTAVGSLGLGIAKEVADLFTPGAEPSLLDLYADWVGIQIGLAKKYGSPLIQCFNQCSREF